MSEHEGVVKKVLSSAERLRPVNRLVLTIDQVKDIFKLKDCHGHATLHSASVSIGRQYHVSSKAIRDIWNGRSWLEVTFELWDEKTRPARKIIGRPKGRKDSKPRQFKAGCEVWENTDARPSSQCLQTALHGTDLLNLDRLTSSDVTSGQLHSLPQTVNDAGVGFGHPSVATQPRWSQSSTFSFDRFVSDSNQQYQSSMQPHDSAGTYRLDSRFHHNAAVDPSLLHAAAWHSSLASNLLLASLANPHLHPWLPPQFPPLTLFSPLQGSGPSPGALGALQDRPQQPSAQHAPLADPFSPPAGVQRWDREPGIADGAP